MSTGLSLWRSTSEAPSLRCPFDIPYILYVAPIRRVQNRPCRVSPVGKSDPEAFLKTAL